MSGWTFAWDPDGADAGEQAVWKPLGVRALLALGVALAAGLFLYAAGIWTTMGWAEGSERHGRHANYVADDTTIGLSTVWLAAGQRAWWDYEVEVEGRGGVWLWIARRPPSAEFHVRTRRIEASGRGRFEIVAPVSGFYSFDHELIPIGGLIGETEPGATRYRLSWGVT